MKQQSEKRIAAVRTAALILTIAILSRIAPVSAADSPSVLWQVLKAGDHVALLRHALAPGTGDPKAFVIGDCSTQRNLSKEGREQARRIGERFASNGIETAEVFSSQWCRCLETADLLGLGLVQELPALNSFFQAFEHRDPQTRELKAWLRGRDLAAPAVLVTHQVNITALTGIHPASGEMVVVRRSDGGDLVVAGTIKTE